MNESVTYTQLIEKEEETDNNADDEIDETVPKTPRVHRLLQ